MTDPTLLRRAIESVGIEKPSDYTLVMEEVERLMITDLGNMQAGPAEDRLVEAERFVFAPSADDAGNTLAYLIGYKNVTSAMRVVATAMDAEKEKHTALIRAATDLVKEAEEMGFGKTSETALPGSFDALVVALNEVKK